MDHRLDNIDTREVFRDQPWTLQSKMDKVQSYFESDNNTKLVELHVMGQKKWVEVHWFENQESIKLVKYDSKWINNYTVCVCVFVLIGAF